MYKTSQAAADVMAERQRQIDVEGFTTEHDEEHGPGEMARAAACYAQSWTGVNANRLAEQLWPWDWVWWKPTNPRRDLVKAGALILAEIERIDRQGETSA